MTPEFAVHAEWNPLQVDASAMTSARSWQLWRIWTKISIGMERRKSMRDVLDAGSWKRSNKAGLGLAIAARRNEKKVA